MTIANERLIEYLGLELELCYLKASGSAVWILADKIRRSDDIAVEMLRLFHRFTRIAKSIDRVNETRSKRGAQAADRANGESTSMPGNNTPYAACIGVRVRVKEHVASLQLRPGIDPETVANAPSISSGMLLDPHFQLQVDDPIVQILARPKEPQPVRALPDERSPSARPKRLKSGEKA